MMRDWLLVAWAVVPMCIFAWQIRQLRRYLDRLLIDAQRAAAGLPSRQNAKPPPADVILRRTHTREREMAFDAQLKAAHEEFSAKHREEFERAWAAQQQRRS